LSVVMLCSIVSGSVFLEGMEKKQVKKVSFTLRFHDSFTYMCITKNPGILSEYASKSFFIKMYGFLIKDNEPVIQFDVSSRKNINCYGKTSMVNVKRSYPEEKSVWLQGVYLPVSQLLDKNNIFKKDGYEIEIEMLEENFNICGTLKNGIWNNHNNTSIQEQLYLRIKKFKNQPDYPCDDENVCKLLKKGILAVSFDKNGHGPNGFDFSIIRTSE